MASFAKIYGSIFTGSLRGRSDELLVFVNILTHTTHEGVCDIHPNTIVDETGLSRTRVTRAIEVLSSPDKDSRSPDCEGRRIVLLSEHRNWGWRVVNHDFYRNLSKDDKYREKTKERVRNHRERQALRQFETLQHVTEALAPLHPVSGSVSVTSSSSEGVQGGNGSTVHLQQPTPPFKGDLVYQSFCKFWNAYPKKAAIYDAQHAWVEVGAASHLDKILVAVEQQKRSHDWTKENGQYIPKPARWLRDGCWENCPVVIHTPVNGREWTKAERDAEAQRELEELRREPTVPVHKGTWS